jgi:O-antigen ligase
MQTMPYVTAVTEVRHPTPARAGRHRRIVATGGFQRRTGPAPVGDARVMPGAADRSPIGLAWAVALGILAGCATFAPFPALRYGMLLCLVIVALHLSPRTRPSSATVFFALFTVDVCLSWCWAADSHAAALGAIGQVGVFSIFLAVRTVVTDRTKFLVIAGGFFLGCFWTVRQISVMNPAALFALRFTDRRFGIPGLNPNYAAYSFVGAIALLGALFWTPTARSVFFRVVSVGLAVPIVWGIALCGTRGAAIGCACLAAWLVACRVLPARPAFNGLVIVVAIGGLGTLTGALDPLLRYFDGLWSRRTGDLAGRLTVWPRAREQISEHPIWGIGTGNFAATDHAGIFTHNLLLEIGVGLGMIGLVLLCLFLVAAFRMTAADSPARLVIVGCFVAASAPIYLSGVWELSPAGWVILALFTRAHVLLDKSGAPDSPGGALLALDRRAVREDRRRRATRQRERYEPTRRASGGGAG